MERNLENVVKVLEAMRDNEYELSQIFKEKDPEQYHYFVHAYCKLSDTLHMLTDKDFFDFMANTYINEDGARK